MGLSACVLCGKDVNALENFAPDSLPCSWCWAEEANGGRGGELCCREAENCPVHFTEGKTVHFGFLPPSTPGPSLSSWILHDQCGVTIVPSPPRLWGQGWEAVTPQALTGGNEL